MAKKHRGDRGSRPSTTQRSVGGSPHPNPTTGAPASGPSRTVLIGAGLGIVAIVLAGGLLLGGLSGLGAGGDRTAAASPVPGATAAPVTAALPADIGAADAAAAWGSGAILLDVREPAEWDAGHVPGAQHIPLAQLAARAGELPSDAIVLVICRSGNRSQEGRDILRAAGLEQVTSVDGGVRAWRDAGLPFEGQII